MAVISFMGPLQDVSGARRMEMVLPDTVTDTDSLRTWLGDRFEDAASFAAPQVRFAVNNKVVNEPAPISNSDDIALLPPFSGG